MQSRMREREAEREGGTEMDRGREGGRERDSGTETEREKKEIERH